MNESLLHVIKVAAPVALAVIAWLIVVVARANVQRARRTDELLRLRGHILALQIWAERAMSASSDADRERFEQLAQDLERIDAEIEALATPRGTERVRQRSLSPQDSSLSRVVLEYFGNVDLGDTTTTRGHTR